MDIDDAREQLEDLLAGESALSHLQIKKRGASLSLHSGQSPNENKHARFTHLRGPIWGLSFPHHSGRWETTPFTGSLEELLQTLVNDFSFFLDP